MIPGTRTTELVPHLRAVESQNITYLAPDFPVFWESADGATIVDVDRNEYVDLTSAFGVANVGHGNPTVVGAIQEQSRRLLHGMGDVHPTEVRTRLLETLPRYMPDGLSKTFLATTGSEAVEAAMKTAVLATGKSRFIAYRGAYHGLAPGALALCGIEKFRTPFGPLVPDICEFLDYPDALHTDAADALRALEERFGTREDIAAVFIEPLQGRGGGIVLPQGYLTGLREWCTRRGILLVADEIYTGFGRTGDWFACNDEGVSPDMLCIGKGMGGGFPISATVGTPKVMDAWPPSSGEALHTSTYLGNPMGCAAALATIAVLERDELPVRAKTLGAALGERLRALVGTKGVRAARGRGMMWSIELDDAAHADRAVKAALRRNVIALQAGPTGNFLSITPPLVIADDALFHAIDVLEEVL